MVSLWGASLPQVNDEHHNSTCDHQSADDRGQRDCLLFFSSGFQRVLASPSALGGMVSLTLIFQDVSVAWCDILPFPYEAS